VTFAWGTARILAVGLVTGGFTTFPRSTTLKASSQQVPPSPTSHRVLVSRETVTIFTASPADPTPIKTGLPDTAIIDSAFKVSIPINSKVSPILSKRPAVLARVGLPSERN